MLFRNITIADENFELQDNMNILVEDDTITYIGKEAPEGYKGEEYDGVNKLAIPGFYNNHCHIPMVMLRGYGEGLDLHRWLFEKIFPFEALLTAEDMYWGSLLGIAEQVASGAVSFRDMYMKVEGTIKAVDESGIKANLTNGFTSGIGSSAGIKDVGGMKDIEAIRAYTAKVEHNRIIADMAIHAEYTSDVALVKDVAAYAKENNMGMHIHLSETQKEQEECKSRRGATPAEYFEQYGVFKVPTTAAHCVWLDDCDFEILARNGVTVAHCPSSNLKLGSGIAPVQKMIEHGINVTIGTDGASSNNNLNMLEEISLASMLQKGINHNPLLLAPKEILQMASVNSAVSQGRSNCGVIKVGNKADILVVNLDTPNMRPSIDVLSNLFYSAQSSEIVLTMVDGKVLYKNGEFKTIDIERVKFNVDRIVTDKLSQLS